MLLLFLKSLDLDLTGVVQSHHLPYRSASSSSAASLQIQHLANTIGKAQDGLPWSLHARIPGGNPDKQSHCTAGCTVFSTARLNSPCLKC